MVDGTGVKPKQEPRVFIGSSSEGKNVAEYLQIALDDYCDTTIWDQGVFEPSSGTLSSILKASDEYDFAILVLTPDDIITKRDMPMRGPRDNVVFELGVFMGSLGAERVFVVHDREVPISILSDLAGITPLTFRGRGKSNLASAVNPVAVKIRDTIKRLSSRNTSMPSSQNAESYPQSPTELLPDIYLGRYICDLIQALPEKRMGISATLSDMEEFHLWSHNLIGMLRDLYSKRQPDAYTAWLRPNSDIPPKLKVFQQHNMPSEYQPYEFRMDEGLAGKVWSTGEAAATSQLRQHPWWVYRDGCLSVSYICVPVGKPKSDGGVLAVGSFGGFNVSDSDLEVVKIFASFLSLTSIQSKQRTGRKK